MRRAIRDNLRDFVAIVVLIVLSLVVGGVILSHQRLYLPAWVPVLGTDFFELKGEFQTAQSVTPGQGQTVNIAGIPVGDISSVSVDDGRAVVTVKIRQKYARLIHSDASMLLRPKTGLNDMTIELDPGTASQRVPEGSTISSANTEPNVNPDEILATLDADTRVFLKALLQSGAEGLGGRGRELAAGLRRFEPTARDISKITSQVAKRRENLRRVIHNFQLLSTELGSKDAQIVEFVDSSNAVFQSFARQEANIRQTLRELPSTLDETNRALSRTDDLARNLGPAMKKLRPAARAFGPTLRDLRPFLTDTVQPIQTQIRPFTRASLPTLKQLKPTAVDLGKAAPSLVSAFAVINRTFNMLAYNPPGEAEGFLFYLSWLNHAGNSLYLTQDAHGPLRRGIVELNCTTATSAKTLGESNPLLKTLTELTNLPTGAELGCP